MPPVNSQHIAEAEYDPRAKKLALRFHSGGVYHYENVEPYQYEEFLRAESKSGYFREHIRGQHKFARIQ